MGRAIAGEPSPPLPNSYWVLPGRLLAGEYPGAADPELGRRKLAALLDAGIRRFLDLTAAGELAPYAAMLQALAGERGLAVAHERHPVPDYDVPADPADMIGILDAIDGALAAGEGVYLHCWGGVGRTGTAVGCHLVRRGLSGPAALERVATLYGGMGPAKRAAHPRSPETAAQRAYVRAWARRDRPRPVPAA